MMPTMKRSQFNEMDFEEFMAWADENLNDVTSEEILIQFAKEKLDNNMGLALHVLNAVYEVELFTDTMYWRYDYSMGTCETPTPITCKEDLEDLIDFEEDDEVTVEEDDDWADDYERRWAERPWDYGKHFDDED